MDISTRKGRTGRTVSENDRDIFSEMKLIAPFIGQWTRCRRSDHHQYTIHIFDNKKLYYTIPYRRRYIQRVGFNRIRHYYLSSVPRMSAITRREIATFPFVIMAIIDYHIGISDISDIQQGHNLLKFWKHRIKQRVSDTLYCSCLNNNTKSIKSILLFS